MTMDVTTTTSVAAVQASYNAGAAAIIAITTTGKTATEASRFRPMCPIIAVTRFHQVARQMQLHRGIMPLFYEGMSVTLIRNLNCGPMKYSYTNVHVWLFAEPRPEDWMKDVDNRIQFGVDFGKNSGFLKSGDAVICITGWRKGAGSSNTIRILTIQ